MPQAHDAFISYSHAADGRLAPLLEAGLEKLARPTFQLRAMNVFRDQTGLAASPGLWGGIVEHLLGSRWFVLLASPASAASPWCSKELLWWLEQRGVASLLVVLTDGEIVWDAASGDFDWARTTALSASLKGRFSEEPLFVDLRWARQVQQPVADDPRLRAAALDLAAPIRGIPKDELDGDDVRQLRRTRLIARAGVAAIAVAALVATWQAIDATRERRQAEAQRDRALSRQLAAQANELRVREPVLALLLAAQAPAAEASPEAGTALLRVLKGLPLERIASHSRRLSSLAVQAGHDTLALGDAAGALLRMDAASGRIEALTPPAANGLLRAASALAVSPDGRAVASAGYAGVITLWQAERPLRRMDTPQTQEVVILGLAFSPDGRTLASTSSSGKVLLHDLAAGTMRALPPAGAAMARVAFSPDGRWLAAGGDGGVMRLWPLGGGAAVPLAFQPGAAITALAFSADGRSLFSAALDGAVALYDTQTGRLQQRVDARAAGELSAAALAPDGQSFVTAHASGVVQRWQRDGIAGSDAFVNWRATELMRHASEVVGVAFLADGRRIASAERNGRVFISRAIDVPALYEVAAGASAVAGASPRASAPLPPAAPAASPHSTPASPAVLSPDGKTRYQWRDGLLQAQDTASGQARGPAVTTHSAAAPALSAWAAPDLAIGRDGRALALTTTPATDYSGATASAPPRVQLYSAQTLAPLAPALELFAAPFTAAGGALFTPDGRWLVGMPRGAGGLDFEGVGSAALTLVDLASAQRLEEPLPMPEGAWTRGFAPGSSRLVFTPRSGGTPLQIDLRIEAFAAQACRLAGRALTRPEWARYVSRELPYRPACGAPDE